MTSLIIAAALVGWSFTDFANDPVVIVSPPAVVVKPVVAAVRTVTLPPTLYRLADASGKVWQHADPVYLRRYVIGVNQAAVTYYQDMPATFHILPAPRGGLFGGRFLGGGGGCMTMPDGSTVCGR